MTCLDENAVLDLMSGCMAESDRARLDEHLDRCPGCRELVAHVVHGVDAAPEGEADLAAATELVEMGEPTELLDLGPRLERYEVIAPLGEGNMGSVWEARDRELDRHVAIKVLHAGGGAEAGVGRARMLAEARALARVAHPAVVSIFDVGAEGDQVWMAMELVDGATLLEWCLKERSWREIVGVLLQAARGVAATHEAGLVHRDIKPDNIMVGDDGRVRLTDFGLAHAAREPDALAGEAGRDASALARRILAGTPAYMSPEQLRGEAVDARSDVFAFCVTAYEALWSQRPFEGRDLASLLAAITAGEARTPPRARLVPRRVRRIILRGLSAEPSERYPDMQSLISELEAALAPRRLRALEAIAAAMLLASCLGGLDCRGTATGVDAPSTAICERAVKP